MSDENSNPKTCGKPTKYKPEYCEKLIEHMSGGYSFETFAAKIGVHRDTLYEWAKVWPEFGEAKDIAFDVCQLFWEKIGIDNIVSKSESESSTGVGGSSRGTSLNSSVYIFIMKARFKLRDKHEGEADVVINNSNTINTKDLSDEELDKRINEKLRSTNPDDERG